MAAITCIIIGEGNIALSCLRQLQESGFFVDTVVTNTRDLVTFCDDCSINTSARKKNIEAILKGKYFDYLFSVNNPTILSTEVLSLARKLTINYHDSLLPAYAGVHATSWAIIQGEKLHGISWHVVEPGIDTGDILEYQAIEIDDNDSALTLNLKCFDACTEAFKRLVGDITGNKLKLTAQNLQNRSYFGIYKVPPNLGVLTFDEDNKHVYNLARALDFGAHDNKLGSPKICTPSGSFLLVTHVDIHNSIEISDYPVCIRNTSCPGRVLDVVCDKIIISAFPWPLSITVAHLDGQKLEDDALSKYCVKRGVDMPLVSGLDMEMTVRLRKKESFWKNILRSYEPTFFFVQKLNMIPHLIDDKLETKETKTRKIILPNTIPFEGYDSLDEFLLVSFIAFVARSCCSPQIHVGLVHNKREITYMFQSLYSSICPAIFEIDFSLPVQEAINEIFQIFSSYRNAGTFLTDMHFRYPELRQLSRHPHHNMVIALEKDITNTAEVKSSLTDCHLLIIIGVHNVTMSYTNKPGNNYSRIADVLHHFSTFLLSITAPQSKHLSLLDVDLISLLEKKTLYTPQHTENGDSVEILQCINGAMRNNPSKIAISTTEYVLSYSELLDEMNNLSSNIQLHIPDEYRTDLKCIALHMTNSALYVICLLASISANSPFLPLPLTLPMNRLAFMLHDARATVMLITRDMLISDKFREFQPSPEVLFEIKTKFGEVVMLHLKSQQIFNTMNQPSSQLTEVYSFTSLADLAKYDDADENPLHPDCCYVMYTSGSSGKPKGVQVLQSGVVNMILAQIDEWSLGPDDVIAQFASIGFDACISEVFTALMSNATLAILSESERLGQEFTTAMSKLEVTTITLPPSVLNIYKPNQFPKLRKVITAGEACTRSTAVRWTENTNLRFFNAYGPTESTVCATIYKYDSKQAECNLSKELPIGKAIRGVQIYLFDTFMKPVPPNLVGEIFIGGKSLSAGYIGHACSKNEECFVENPFFPGCKLYKTGDHAVQAEDGTLTYFGRIDSQVKIRGQRVDLNEVEQVLLQHTKVELAVVVRHQTAHNVDPTIAAFIAPTSVIISELQEYLSKTLPTYMIPSHIKKYKVEEFPTNINGKIDRKKLEKDQSIIEMSTDRDANHLNPIELQMARLWCKTIELDQSRAYSMNKLLSFAELGGNSLHMVLLQRAIEKEFGILFPFTDLTAASNIQDFSDLITRQNNHEKVIPKQNISVSKEEWNDMIIQDAKFDPNQLGITTETLFSKSTDIENHPKNILLSGTTGFLGAFLLYEILEQTVSRVFCMVRDSNEVSGFGRVVSNMKKNDLWKTSYKTRIAIVLSDISNPRMGITSGIYKYLSTTIDIVFMNAAKMSFNTDYFDHRVSNVEGTKEFIKFCFTGRKKLLFATSSLGVFLFPPQNSTTANGNSEKNNSFKFSKVADTNGNWKDPLQTNMNDTDGGNGRTEPPNKQRNDSCDTSLSIEHTDRGSYFKHSYLTKTKPTYIELISNSDYFKFNRQSINGVDAKVSDHSHRSIQNSHDMAYTTKRIMYKENDQINDPSTLSGGYNQSKWASEQLVRQALKYLPGGAIFRPARVSGNSKTGVGPTNDLFACMIKGIESLKCVPDLNFPYDLTPVNYCARGMIEITVKIYQSQNGEMPIFYHFFNEDTIPFIDLFDVADMEIMPLQEWRNRIKSADSKNELLPFIPFIQSEFWNRSPDWPVFNCDNTLRHISPDCKKLLLSSERLLKLYKRFFKQSIEFKN